MRDNAHGPCYFQRAAWQPRLVPPFAPGTVGPLQFEYGSVVVTCQPTARAALTGGLLAAVQAVPDIAATLCPAFDAMLTIAVVLSSVADDLVLGAVLTLHPLAAGWGLRPPGSRGRACRVVVVSSDDAQVRVAVGTPCHPLCCFFFCTRAR